ncbi:dynamin family protein [Paenibacillus sp. MMS20-IR301]|uniref:dynamin family protein n=1 Tax=Paenibacillus sp. MMS20-IR301 TaxID=2895946 RepID=UPI0028F115FF|nr:dynamin family protein [Paenibacillus sp. MMS20-IR301]WNS41538.1 dynamin family protein [Paenibacillus sp. MMS20-IR301]
MESNRQSNFVTSHSFIKHPLRKAKKKTRMRYYVALDHFVREYAGIAEYANARLLQYQEMLIESNTTFTVTDRNRNSIIRSVVNDSLRPWMWKYRFWLTCDIALILADKNAIEKVQEDMQRYLNKRQRAALSVLVSYLFNDKMIPPKMLFAEGLIYQFRLNRSFTAQQEQRVLITANMSAGKSTLINALIGKQVARTSQEACTADLHYYLNKPVEDGSIHLRAGQLNLNAAYEDLMDAEQVGSGSVASYFRSFVQSDPQRRICLIDTPGVNSAINREHGSRTRKALMEEQYDKLIYVLNANQLGTDEEIRYLKYISGNVPSDKVVFVLNKLDHFKSADDSIAASIEGVKTDLLQLGYKNPTVYPLSAYFALLLKRKQNGELLTEDEQDEYDYYVKKFSRPEFDLSVHLNTSTAPLQTAEDKQLALAASCGLYSLENILYGGSDQ